jgi:hypothetical protein
LCNLPAAVPAAQPGQPARAWYQIKPCPFFPSSNFIHTKIAHYWQTLSGVALDSFGFACLTLPAGNPPGAPVSTRAVAHAAFAALEIRAAHLDAHKEFTLLALPAFGFAKHFVHHPDAQRQRHVRVVVNRLLFPFVPFSHFFTVSVETLLIQPW